MKPIGVLRSCLVHLAAALLALALGPGCRDGDGGRAPGGTSTTLTTADGSVARIVRDDFGIPHIWGDTTPALFEAYGYAVAQDRLWQLELHRRAGRGRLAEVFGEMALIADQYIRMTGYTDGELEEQLALLSPDIQDALHAYAAGINRYVSEVVAPDPANRLPYEFHALGFFPEPWTVLDSAAFGVFMARRFGEVGSREGNNLLLLEGLISQHGPFDGYAIFNDLRWFNDPDAPVTIPATESSGRRAKVKWPRSPRDDQRGIELQGWRDLEGEAKAAWERLGVPTKLGSYGWVVSGARSAEGHPMLYGGPQMGFSAPEVVHEVQLKGGDGFNVAGMAFAGIVPVLIGRNEQIAWTSTTGMGDNVDLYLELLCPFGRGYFFSGSCRRFEDRTEVIYVRDWEEPQVFTFRRSVHGPVLGTSGAFAVSQKRAHWGQELNTFAAFFGFNRASTLQQFEQAVEAVATSHNFLYADRAGNIAYWQAGFVPWRPVDFDPRLPFPGTGIAEWPGGNRPLPRSVNPAQGYLANWNNKPSVDFDNADSTKFGKQQRVLEIDARLAAGPISLDDMRDIPKDIGRVRVLGREGRYLLPYLFAALDAVPPAHPVAPAARAVLEAWDGSATEDVISSADFSPGEIIFTTWVEILRDNTFIDELGDARGEGDTNVLLHVLDFALTGYSGVPPSRDYLNGVHPYGALSAAFEQAVGSLAAERGGDPSTWTGPRWTITFSHPLLGDVATIPASNRATYGQIVVLDPARPRAGETILTMGQSGFIPSGGLGQAAHFMDQLPLYRLFQYKPMPLLESATCMP